LNIRLADLLNDVFDISGFVFSSIRSQLNNAWEGVKSAGEFISNTVSLAIITSIVNSVTNLIFSLGYMIENLYSSSITVEFTSNGIIINNSEKFEIKQDGLEITLFLGTIDINLGNLFKNFIGNNLETLSVTSDHTIIANLVIKTIMALTSISIFKDPSPVSLNVLMSSILLLPVQLYTDMLLVQTGLITDPEEYYSDMAQFHGISVAGHLLSLIMFAIAKTGGFIFRQLNANLLKSSLSQYDKLIATGSSGSLVSILIDLLVKMTKNSETIFDGYIAIIEAIGIIAPAYTAFQSGNFNNIAFIVFLLELIQFVANVFTPGIQDDIVNILLDFYGIFVHGILMVLYATMS
jgi:hypothetical protein